MKIAVIYSQDLPNTYANSINTLKHADAFHCLGHEVTVFYISLKKNNNLHEFYDISKEINFKVFKENFFFSLTGKFWKKIQTTFDLLTNTGIRDVFDTQKKIADFIIQNNFDFVYARNFRASYYIIKSGIPIVVETHTANLKNRQMEKILGLNSYTNFKISTINEILKQNFINYGMLKENIIVQEDAVDISKFKKLKQSKTELRKQLNLPVNKKIITYSGSLRSGKGLNSLFLVSEKMKENEDILFLIIGGANSEKQEYEKQAKEKALYNILFTGFVLQDKIPFYLKASDILIMLYSNLEKNRIMDINTTSPIKLFEYMASQTPIIASNIPTVAKIIEHKKHALMPKTDDIAEIKKSILTLLANKELRQLLTKNAFELAKKHTYTKRCKNLIYGKNS